jgi:potassium channel subfamily K, other eukaryote
VNWYTQWIGNNTQNIYNLLKAVARRHNLSEIKNAATSANKEKKLKLENENDDGFEKIARLEHQNTHLPVHFNADDLTELQASVAEEKYRPFMLLKAADHILTKHLDADPPRKYSFKEWSWLLKLLGEDETDETRHRRVGLALPDDMKVVSPVNTGEKMEGEVWSWLGQESPLMSLEEGKG